MDRKLIPAFYWGAAMYHDMDSPEVDSLLVEHGLNVQDNTVEACRDCIKQYRQITPPPFLPPSPPPSPYISITQAAAISGLSRRTINAACLRDDIEGVQRGTRNEWKILPRALQAWMDNPSKHQPGPKPDKEQL